MSLIDDLRKRIGTKKKITLRSLIRKQTGCSGRNIYIADKHIDLVSDDDMNDFLERDKTNNIPWKVDISDCDDISRIFWNNAKIWFYKEKNINAAVGMVWAKGHAFNYYVRKDFKVIGVEPQTDKRIPIPSRPVFVIG